MRHPDFCPNPKKYKKENQDVIAIEEAKAEGLDGLVRPPHFVVCRLGSLKGLLKTVRLQKAAQLTFRLG